MSSGGGGGGGGGGTLGTVNPRWLAPEILADESGATLATVGGQLR